MRRWHIVAATPSVLPAATAMPMITLDHLKRHAIARSLFAPTTLPQALRRLGFVQADPIRAPARAQDLTLRHRVRDYRAGDLERRYARLGVEEDYFVNYGFLQRDLHHLMHPRTARTTWSRARWKQAHEVLDFVRERGVVHPREVDAQFAHGKTRNWFGGSSNASTQLLDGMHYRGLLRVARREGGIRLYAAREQALPAANPEEGLDQLADVVLQKYAPLPLRSLTALVSHLRLGAPQWAAHRKGAVQRLLARTAHADVDGVRWVWPAGENPASRRHALDDRLRLLAPFDPIVWDRARFELFWGWPYRFEAYTPAPRRVRGYYALPLLWQGRIDGWANVSLADGQVQAEVGWLPGRGRDRRAWTPALEHELSRMALFLGCDEGAFGWRLQRTAAA
jgi:hypothetical protein